MKFYFLALFLVFSVNSSRPSTNPDSFCMGKDSLLALAEVYINQIIIAGNNVTDDDIVRREMLTKENSKLNLHVLEEDVQRIYNLGLFNKVDVIPVNDSLNRINLMILVEERFYIIPIPQGGFRNGEFSKFWAGLNLQWKNFRGRNETAALSFGIGYEPFIKLRYSVPWIGQKAHFFSSASVGYEKNFNRSLVALHDSISNSIPSTTDNFANYNFHSSFTLGKYFGKDFSLSSSINYNAIRTSQYEPGRTVTSDGRDEFITVALGGKFDTRNSREYTLSGSYYALEYRKYGLGKIFDFNRINIETRKFIPIKLKKNYSITLATRMIGIVSFGGLIPSYLHEFFGYNKIIRGYKQVVFEGENQLGLFNEFRIPIIDPFYIKGTSIPLVNKISFLKKLSYKFGMYTTLFFDVGGVWDKRDNLFKTEFKNGFGVGFNFILPFGFIGRTDFAFRKEQKRFVPQIIVDLDAAF